MDENKDIAYTSPAQTPEPPAAPVFPKGWRAAAAPVMALVLSVLFWQTFALTGIFSPYGPGLGVFVFTAAYFAAVLALLGFRKRPGAYLLAGAALVLALCCALYACPGPMLINCFVILLCAAGATFSLSGHGRYGAFDARSIPDTVRLSFMALFTRVDRPFKAFGRLGKGKKRAVGPIVLTALVSVALLALVLALLSSADMVFGSFFTGVGAWLEGFLNANGFWRIIRDLTLALFIASGLYFICEPAPEAAPKEKAPRAAHTAPFLVPALLLDAVYVLFCAVQLRYLFGGAEAASMAGGWAEYARTGFFQLAAVAAINLALCLAGAKSALFGAKGGALLRVADGALLVLTAVILLSAARRMQLYIGAYGMSMLRLETLWIMLVIAAGILAAGWKLLRPDFAFSPVFLGFALGTWCLFCLANPAGRVASYNVDAYLAGRLDSVDVDYLRDLSPDAAPALRRLARASDEYDAEVRHAFTAFESNTHEHTWAQWKFSFLNSKYTEY